MRSQHGERTGGLSSGRVLAPVVDRTLYKLTFVMLLAATVNLASNRRMRTRRGGNGGRGVVSSGLCLASGQRQAKFVETPEQEQTGIGRMERAAAATEEGAVEGEDDHEAELERIKFLLGTEGNGPKGLR